MPAGVSLYSNPMNGNTDRPDTANGAVESESASSNLLVESPMFKANIKAFRSEFPKLLKNYNGQWVAFYNGRFEDHDTSKIHLYRKCEKKGWDVGDVLVYRVKKDLPEYEEWHDDSNPE